MKYNSLINQIVIVRLQNEAMQLLQKSKLVFGEIEIFPIYSICKVCRIYFIKFRARAELSSQFEGNWLLLIGTLSV